MKVFRSLFIVFLVSLTLVACTAEKDKDIANNEASNENEIKYEGASTQEDELRKKINVENEEMVIERSFAEEFNDLREIMTTIERYLAFLTNYENDDPNDTKDGVAAVVEIISANEEDINGGALATMIGYATFVQYKSYNMESMKKLNDNLYLIRGKYIVREEFSPGEINYKLDNFNPYVFKEDGKFKLALVKDRIPEHLYDRFDDIEENYDLLRRWSTY